MFHIISGTFKLFLILFWYQEHERNVPDIAQSTHGIRNIFADIRNVPTRPHMVLGMFLLPFSVSAIIFFKQINALSIAPPHCMPLRFIGSIHRLCIAYLPGGCSPHPADHSTGSVHLLCTAYLAGGVGGYVCRYTTLRNRLFTVNFYIRKSRENTV